MKRQLEQVMDFHNVFGCHAEDRPTAELPPEATQIRAGLMQEELDEYREAVAAGDLTRVADALSDLLYVVLGTYIAHGLQDHAAALFDEVHRSNMEKLGDDGRPILRQDGKILKPPGWRPPALEAILQRGE